MPHLGAKGSFVPSGLGDLGASLGDVITAKSSEGILQGIQSKIPWWRASLPDRRTALGKTIPAQSGLSVGDPFKTTVDPSESSDAVLKWVAVNHVDLTKPQRLPQENAGLYYARLTYVGTAVYDRLAEEIKAMDGKPLENRGTDRLGRMRKAVRKAATARWLMIVREYDGGGRLSGAVGEDGAESRRRKLALVDHEGVWAILGISYLVIPNLEFRIVALTHDVSPTWC